MVRASRPIGFDGKENFVSWREERLVSLGACWASSIQPVLLSVWRPLVLLSRESNLGQAIHAVTGGLVLPGISITESFGDSLVSCIFLMFSPAFPSVQCHDTELRSAQQRKCPNFVHLRILSG